MHPALMVFSLPEIIFGISPLLSTPDLFSCVQVCHIFHNALLQSLWLTVDTSLHSWPHILKHYDSEASKANKDEAWIHHVFMKHGHFIRHLTIRSRVLLDAAYLAGSCTNLLYLSITLTPDFWTVTEKKTYKHMEALKLVEESTVGPCLSPAFEGAFGPRSAQWRTKEQQDRNWISNQYMWLLLRQQSALQTLHLCTRKSPLAHILSKEVVFDILASLPHLAHLESDDYDLDISRLVDRVPPLWSLVTRKGFPGDGLLVHPSSNIRVLFVKLCIKTENFFGYLRAFPNLEKFSIITSVSEPICWNGGTILNNTPSRLKELVFPTPCTFPDFSMARSILPWLPDLARIRIGHLGPLTAKALVAHCTRLQGFHQEIRSTSFRNVESYRAYDNVVNELLWRCTDLVDVDAPDYRIDVDKTLRLSWKCLGLETLRLKITGVVRLTESEESILAQLTLASEPESSITVSSVPPGRNSDESDKPTSTTTDTVINMTEEQSRVLVKSKRSQEQHRQIYIQLSRLTRLKVLDIGHAHDWPTVRRDDCNPINSLSPEAPILDTLELSLKSGLSVLATLTQLEVFRCEYVDHRIGAEELAWMGSHWPRLRET